MGNRSIEQFQSTVIRPRKILITLTVIAALWLLSFLIEQQLSKMILSELSEQAASIQMDAKAKDVTVNLFRLTPSIEIQNLSVGAANEEPVLETADITMSLGWLDTLRKPVSIAEAYVSNARLNFLTDENGSHNWIQALNTLVDIALNSSSQSVMIENLQVSETSIEYINDKYSQTGFFDINGNWLLSDQLPALSATLSGDINFLPLNLEVSANVEQSDNMHPGTASITADLGEKNSPGLFSLSIEASTDNISTFENSLIRTSISGHDTDKLLGRLGYSSLQISELRFQGNTRYSQDNVFDSSYALTLDDSSATTNFVVTGVPIHAERAVELPMLSGSIEIEDLFLDSFMQTDIATKRSVGVSNSVASKHLFSEKPYGIFSNQIIPTLDVNISVERFFSGGLLLKGLNAELKKKENEASLIIDSDDPDTGQFQSTLHITKTGKDINGKLDARILGLAINDVLTAMDVGTGTASGKISGEAKFWFDADSPAMAAKTLDGGMFLIVEQGKLDSLLIEMAGIDFMESIGLVVNRDPQQSEIRCGYADFQASNGLIEVEDFIVDTEDSVFLASGNINLREETINLKLSPHPRDTSYFAATTPIHVRGALTNPKFRPGRKLYTRLALAAAMATLAGPAAVVLPFIELGTSSENSYCKQLFEN